MRVAHSAAAPAEITLQGRVERAVASAIGHIEKLTEEAEKGGAALDRLALYELRDRFYRSLDQMIELAP